MDIKSLKPSLLWQYFDQLTAIPRPSGGEQRVMEWLKKVATEHSLEYLEDVTGNLLIRAAATAGRENSPVVTMQAHVDMVCEKRGTSSHNFETDPIKTFITDDGWLKAQDTTLGADCGIGVAAALAALTDPELEHGAIEALFTVDEERGLTGAFGLGEGMINGDYLLNLDSEDEGEIFIGCAGGVDTTAYFGYKSESVSTEMVQMRISVGGLQGGHSGDDINKGRGNAVKILSRVLFEASLLYGVRLIRMDCGNLKNAIPREGYADIALEVTHKVGFTALFEGYRLTIGNECMLYDKGVELKLEEIPSQECSSIDMGAQFSLLGALVALPNGVMEVSKKMAGLVETSSNLAAVKFVEDNKIRVVTSQRSSEIEGREKVRQQIASAFTSAGAEVTHSNGYPGWSPNPDSEILRIASESYQSLFGVEPKVRAIHAGLECGLFLESYPDLDMISFGPTMMGVHSPDERLEVASVEKFWSHLSDIISRVK